MNTRFSSQKQNWKRGSCTLLLTLLLCTSLIQAYPDGGDDTLRLTYSFSTPSMELVDIAGTTYSRITAPDCPPAGSAGEPKLPSQGVFILLPPHSTVENIEVTTGEKILVGTGVTVEPTSQAIPLSFASDLPIPTPNPMIYSTDGEYPGTLFTNVGIYHFRGYAILVGLLHPYQYNPVAGEVSYYTSFTLTISTTPYDDPSASFYRGLSRDAFEVQQKVDNPEMTMRYQQQYPSQPTPREQYDLLILTTDALSTAFEPLQQAHTATGVTTVIKTLTDVGASDLDSIRNYLRSAYTDWGVNYVLIGGDDNVIPDPWLWVSGMDENTTYYDDYMPSDIYYACLDGPFNYDGDNKWGEPTDGEGGGDVDLIADVYVGRACVGTTAEVTNFVAKTVAYINKDLQNPFFSEVCFAGEYMGEYGIASYASSYLEQLEDGCSDDGYTTVGIPSNVYTITKLYDSPTYDWPPSAIIALINNGVHIINHLGHASYDYNLKIDSYDVDGLTNPANRTCFIYSQGCMSGGYDNGDCIAEHFTVKTTHAAFAGIWNARYGWFWSYSTDGDSQRLHRQFWDAVFGENIAEIGRANHDSKEDNLPIIGRSCIRWCYYETNLFGDPALQIIAGNSPPAAPAAPVGPTSGYTEVTYLFSTSTTDPEEDALYYQWDWGDGTLSDWLGPYDSGETASASHSWDNTGDYQVTVRAKDGSGTSAWSDPAAIQILLGPHVEIGSISGGLHISAEVLNTGMIDATEVNWTIALQGLVLFGQETSGKILSIAPDSSSTVQTDFVFGLGRVDIVITAADTEKTATGFLLGLFIFNIHYQ
ncbi:MAG: PKD domain-containing protein [Candidatus Thermoplasmatota archaeon]|nr:PKD domain-containing protein [Candidatus Thermoplasmatota archaeon]